MRCEQEERSSPAGASPLAIVLLTALAALVRAPFLFTDLHIDEVYSFQIAQSSKSVFEIFSFRHDNNHLLNTTYLWFLPRNASFASMRLLSFLAGVALIPAIFFALRRLNVISLVMALLVVFSYPFVFYSTEARGYMPMLLFITLAHGCFVRADRGRSMFWSFAFGCLLTLALLSHLSATHYVFGIMMYHLLSARSGGTSCAGTGKLFFFPVCTLGAFTIFFVQGIQIAGGQVAPIELVALNAILMPLGLSMRSSADIWIVACTALPVLFVLALELRVVESSCRATAAAFVIGGVLSPLILMVLQFRAPIFERYFLISMFGEVALIAAIITRYASHRGSQYRVAICALILFVGSNALKLSSESAMGRGRYSRALQTVAAESHGGSSYIMAPSGTTTEILLQFYLSRTGLSERLKAEYSSVIGSRWILEPRADNAALADADAPVGYRLFFDAFAGELAGERWIIWKRSL